jgi:hypothetical protein
MIKLSFFILLLTIPLLDGTPFMGVPMWVYGSLAATVIYGIMLIIIIERRWDDLKDDHDR